MTINEFLDQLEPGDWSLDADGNLCDRDDRCPLWHVYETGVLPLEPDDVESAQDYHEAGLRCGLRSKDAIAIAQAADNRAHPRIRRRLLTRLGLSE